MRPRTALLTTLSASCLLAGPTSAQQGLAVPELAFLDQVMHDFMDLHGIDAGVLGVMRNGVIVYQRGFRDASEIETMRIASVEKPLTAAAVRILESRGQLEYGDFVFDLGQVGIRGRSRLIYRNSWALKLGFMLRGTDTR